MAWDFFSVYKYGAETAHELHVLNVYKDPEFIKDASVLALKYRKNLMINIPMAEVIDKTNELSFENITEKYCLTGGELVHYYMGFTELLPLARDYPYDFEWDKNDNCTVTFNSSITKDDFDEIWKMVARHKKARYGNKIPRNKPPEHDRLVYAIYKARHKSPPARYAEIFRQYQDNVLPYFEGGESLRLKSAEKLKDYYLEYKPRLENESQYVAPTDQELIEFFKTYKKKSKN